MALQTMTIPEEQDGKSENDPNLARDAGQKATPSSRQGGADLLQAQRVRWFIHSLFEFCFKTVENP